MSTCSNGTEQRWGGNEHPPSISRTSEKRAGGPKTSKRNDHVEIWGGTAPSLIRQDYLERRGSGNDTAGRFKNRHQRLSINLIY